MEQYSPHEKQQKTIKTKMKVFINVIGELKRQKLTGHFKLKLERYNIAEFVATIIYSKKNNTKDGEPKAQSGFRKRRSVQNHIFIRNKVS